MGLERTFFLLRTRRTRHVTYDACCRWLASTTFEPNEARRAFPCFDEPGFKARFQVNLASRDDVVALSNMPRRSVHNMYVCQGTEFFQAEY
jgi:aminopeptidase N